MARMKPPDNGIKIRMYRQGHGDCFLMATKDADDKAFYILIDCGLKKNSELFKSQTIDKVISDIADATNNFIDVVMITHEHEDHVNGFGALKPNTTDKRYFDQIEVGEVWLAWTENGDDDDANDLRRRYEDTLYALLGARKKLLGMADSSTSSLKLSLDELLDFEGDENDLDEFYAAYSKSFRMQPDFYGSNGNKPRLGRSRIDFKKAMRYMRKKVPKSRIRFLDPKEERPHKFQNVAGILVYPLGPPRDEHLLTSLNPRGDEEFKFALSGGDRSLISAYNGDDKTDRSTKGPFEKRFGYDAQKLEAIKDKEHRDFFQRAYGWKNSKVHGKAWRRIDLDWLMAAEDLALRLDEEVNNTSLVVAIELPNTKKVLLFTGDAQRGSWISWSDLSWTHPDGSTVTAKELLGRTVLHKVSHHGSHNGTLKGKLSDSYANLSWLAQGSYKHDYVALIPSNEVWAKGKSRPWKHPLKALEDALFEKADGRVLMTNRKYGTKFPKQPAGTDDGLWKEFQKNAKLSRLYIECTIED
ncbi:MBL fold metallo-hydrolase [Sulfitobacter geojensis]|uniref:MBL fold metallo-hydrolase n=1 Tax=Sulfitobacter geojensis TaxID=1342299 RepID=UPI0036DCBA8F